MTPSLTALVITKGRNMKYRIYSTIDKNYVDNTRNLVLDASGKIRALGGITMNPERGMIAEMCLGIKDCGEADVFQGDVFHIEDEFYGRIVFKQGNFYVEEFDFQTPDLVVETESVDNYTWDQVAILGNIHCNSRDFSQHF